MTDWDNLIPPPSPVLILQDRLVFTAKQAVLNMTGFNILKEHNNKVPTHDPYTNPDSQIYYECKCGAILDPGTKSFASLNNHASLVGWKIRFSSDGYIPYCVKCGEGVE